MYFIGAVILATLSIQVYWNYKNYRIGKQQLLNDVQTSLDNAVDSYYTQLAKNSTFNFRTPGRRGNWASGGPDSLRVRRDSSAWQRSDMRMNIRNFPERISLIQSRSSDSIGFSVSYLDSISHNIERASFMGLLDSVANPVENLSSKIIVSFTEDTLSLKKIDSILQSELSRKNISIDYGLKHLGFLHTETTLRPELIEGSKMQTSTTSPYFFYNNSLSIHFSNITLAILKKNLMGILLSFLLVGSVLFCMLYLLRIIKQQKQLAEVKNDLISNITHEFKTPIATIGVAMEAISAFNSENDTEKNLRYVKISAEQVDKLNGMVEKLLETATLDSEQLHLNLERLNLVELLRNAANKEAFMSENKQLTFESSEEEIWGNIDKFHFENAINNIVDNALKYGGNEITISVGRHQQSVLIKISDSGNSLTDTHKKQIFEKFYRVPKGNTHDVKGFGIGLYYTKTIIEKHQGSIVLETNGHTTFKIMLPHG